MAIYHFHVTQISRGKGQTAETLAFVEKHHISKLDDFQSVVTNLYNQVATLRKEIRELQAEKKGVEEMLRMYQQYKETLLVYKEYGF